jgi:hypothetical protein
LKVLKERAFARRRVRASSSSLPSFARQRLRTFAQALEDFRARGGRAVSIAPRKTAHEETGTRLAASHADSIMRAARVNDARFD